MGLRKVPAFEAGIWEANRFCCAASSRVSTESVINKGVSCSKS